MNGKRVLALVLLALGVLALAYQGFTYTTQKKVVDIGPIQATKSEHHTIPLPPVIGVIAVIAGIVILATDRSS
jgi:formate hydrogenlyase subunit 4